MKRFGLVLLVFIFAISLGGCSCLQKEVKSETAPPVQVVEKAPPKAPEPVKPPPPPPPPKKDRN
jgi:hypothetical protein